MKILYYFSKNQSVMYRWQAYHIFDELRNYNCEFDEFYPEDYESVEDANKALINRCKYTKYDMFMTSHNEKNCSSIP